MPDWNQLREFDRRHVWHAFTQMAEYEPLIIERAEGCWLYDSSGAAYLDGVASMWCNVHGHNHPHINAAMEQQLHKVSHVTSLGLSNATTIRLARKLAELAPGDLDHIFFSDSGATAVEVALKLAFQYWRQRSQPEPQRTKFLALDAAYHGDTIGSVSVGGVARFHAMFEPLLFEVLRFPAPNAFERALIPEPTEHLAQSIIALEKLLAEHGDSIAAVILEPLVQCAAGMLMHPPGFLRAVRELTQRHDILLIADEVAVGLGRTGTLFACEQEQVVPDLLCLAKGLSGGYLPVAATLATSEIWQAFLGRYEESRAFFHGHTFGGNPLGCAAALANLELFELEGTLAKLPTKIIRLAEHLVEFNQLPYVSRVRQRGLMAAFDLVDPATGNDYPWEAQRGMAVCRRALQEQVWLRPLGSTLYLMPPLAIALEEMDLLCEGLAKALRATLG